MLAAACEACATHFGPVADGLSPADRAKDMGRRRSWRHRWLGRERAALAGVDGERRASETARRKREKAKRRREEERYGEEAAAPCMGAAEVLCQLRAARA